MAGEAPVTGDGPVDRLMGAIRSPEKAREFAERERRGFEAALCRAQRPRAARRAKAEETA